MLSIDQIEAENMRIYNAVCAVFWALEKIKNEIEETGKPTTYDEAYRRFLEIAERYLEWCNPVERRSLIYKHEPMFRVVAVLTYAVENARVQR